MGAASPTGSVPSTLRLVKVPVTGEGLAAAAVVTVGLPVDGTPTRSIATISTSGLSGSVMLCRVLALLRLNL